MLAQVMWNDWETSFLRVSYMFARSFFGSFIVRSAAAQVYIDVTVSQAKSVIGMNPSLVILDVRNQSGL
jgi:hypothetical protein